MTSDENVVRTSYDKIWVLRKNGASPPHPSPANARELLRIEELVVGQDEAGLRRLAAEYIPENQLPGLAPGLPADGAKSVKFSLAAS